MIEYQMDAAQAMDLPLVAIEPFGGVQDMPKEVAERASEQVGWNERLIADALRMFGQGMKVCVEIVAMATDANLVPVTDVIAIAGTARGADTATVIAANSTNRFFDIKVREILAKPKNF